MSYTITITESKTSTAVKKGDYVEIGQEFISPQDYEELSYEDRKQWKRISDDTVSQFMRRVYDYAPAKETTVSTEKKIYEQTVEKLDIISVIKAINI